jgi:HEAT repeat protein
MIRLPCARRLGSSVILAALAFGVGACDGPGAVVPVTPVAPTATAAASTAPATTAAAIAPAAPLEGVAGLYARPARDRAAAFREAAAGSDARLREIALAELAWAGDPMTVGLAIAALGSPALPLRRRAAQAIALVGPAAAEAAARPLAAALAEVDGRDQAAFVGALVAIGDRNAVPRAIELARAGRWPEVVRAVGAAAASSARAFARLGATDELVARAADTSPALRRVVAEALARGADHPKAASVLARLAHDPDLEVRRVAVGGLARRGDAASRAAALEALRSADDRAFAALVDGVRDLAAGPGLALALDAVPARPPEKAWAKTTQIFVALRELADPRASDALLTWLATRKPGAHFAGEVGARLAEVGDLRGAKLLAERLKIEPTSAYRPEHFWEVDEGGHLSRTDRPRVVAARLLGDLATAYPAAQAELRAAAEDAVLAWLDSRPSPHALGLRFLAAVRSDKALAPLRAWAFPSEPLPKEGASPPFPAAFETAQHALRALGRAKDEPSFARLVGELDRKKDPKLDVSEDALVSGSSAMLGMALRALASGAAEGLGEWGDPRAVGALARLAEDATAHEHARTAACEALAWSGDEAKRRELLDGARREGASADPKRRFLAACYAASLFVRPAPALAPEMAEALGSGLSPEVDLGLARALGVAGFDGAVEARLLAKLGDPAARTAAAFALLLGGSIDGATRAAATVAAAGPDATAAVSDHLVRALAFVSDEDVGRGVLARWAANAGAVARVEVAGARQTWARERIAAALRDLPADAGPRSISRLVVRARLVDAARGADAERRAGALATLALVGERGALLALAERGGPAGAAADAALADLEAPPLSPSAAPEP